MVDYVGQLGFTGNFDMTLDDKGRMTTPASFVKVLNSLPEAEQGDLIATISLNKTVAMLPVKEWVRWMESIDSLPALDASSRRLQTLTPAFSFQVSLDGNNRVRVPQQLLDMFAIKKEVTVVGMKKHFEIWDRKAWSDFTRKTLENLSESAQDALAH
ncbi:MAG: hypothetical protein NTW86_16095 [Candidatus Sumerlaeota bacterium]|nr:hypothetical protein [Candidatus Sumerlaeota bacterium]